MAFMSSLGAGDTNGYGMAPAESVATIQKPKHRFQKFIPLIHILSSWLLIAFFVVWKEPEAFLVNTTSAIHPGGVWRRWADLGRLAGASDGGWSVQAMVRVLFRGCFLLN